MNATDIKHAVTEHKRQLSKLEQRKALFEAARQEALAAPPSTFNQADVDEATAAADRLERQLVSERDRVAALERQLPSEKALQEANALAARLKDEIEAARARHEAAWKEFVSLAQRTEDAARSTADAHGACKYAVGCLTDLARQFALPLTIPHAAAMPREYAEVVGLTGALISNVAYSGEIGTTVEHGLNAAKRALPAES